MGGFVNFCSHLREKTFDIRGKISGVFYSFFSSEKRKLVGRYSRVIPSISEGIPS